MQTNSPFIPPDIQARDTAVLETTKNIIVEAGAGTGKTTLLTDRLCYLILGEAIPIDKIIALTFTEKAAAEIKSRLLDKMQKILLCIKGEFNLPDEQKEKEKKQKEIDELKKLIKKIHKKELTPEKEKEANLQLAQRIEKNFELAERAIISTIHGFCFKVLRQYPSEAGISPDCTPEPDDAIQVITDKSWSAFLEEELQYTSPKAKIWEELLGNFTLAEIKDFALALLKQPMQNYNPKAKNLALADFFDEKAKRLQFLFEAYNCGDKNNIDIAVKKAEELLKNAALYYRGLPSEKLSAEAFPKSIGITKNWTDKDDYNEAKDIINNLAKHASLESLELFEKAQQAVAGFLIKARADLRSSNILTFNDMILKTKDLVKNNPHIRLQLKKEYKSILLDEFQDTDPEQGEIFLFLAEEENSSAKNWRDIKLKPGKLFIVGDPKQSIYRFRGADISAYDNFLDKMKEQGAIQCFLQSNFRSSENIVNFANKFGSSQIKEVKRVQPKYVEIQHTQNYLPKPVEIISITNGKEASAEEMRIFQSEIIAKWIKENVAKTKLSNGKTISYRDITVLYRSSTGLDILINAFKRNAIAYSVEENKNFYQAQEIKDLINILKLAENPFDKIALVGVLRSPLCLVKDEEILNLSQKRLLNIYEDTKDEYINSCYGTLRTICRNAKTMPPEEFIDYIIFQTRFKELEILASLNEQTSANISKFIEIIRGFASKGILTLPQLIHHIEFYFKEREKEGESPLAEESLDTVKLMTMHKSKGLQAPVVIIYDLTKLDKQGNKTEPSFLNDWTTGLCGARLGNNYDCAYSVLKYSNLGHSSAEELRILYVAFTRAKEILVLLGTENAEKTMAESLLRAGCYPGEEKPEQLLGGICKVSYLPFYANIAFALSAGSAASNDTPALDLALWKEKYLQRSQNYKDDLKATPTPSAQNHSPVLTPEQISAMLTGRICHRILSTLLQNGTVNINNAAIIEGANPAENTAEIQEAKQIMNAFKQSAAFAKLSGMKLLSAELPFSMKDALSNTYINGIIDAVFEDKDGQIFIAEFKSDKINKEQIEAAAKKYMPQIKEYLKAAELIFSGKTIRGGIIFLRPQEIYYLGEN